jgi:hypothetical protein
MIGASKKAVKILRGTSMRKHIRSYPPSAHRTGGTGGQHPGASNSFGYAGGILNSCPCAKHANGAFHHFPPSSGASTMRPGPCLVPSHRLATVVITSHCQAIGSFTQPEVMSRSFLSSAINADSVGGRSTNLRCREPTAYMNGCQSSAGATLPENGGE